MHPVKLRLARAASTLALLVAGVPVACIAPQRDAGTVVMASGADLQSANPLVTVHPLARQVQRYALFVTLLRYDSLLAPVPYFARRWEWSSDRRVLRLHLAPDLSWSDGTRTTAHDVAFTLLAARDPRTGYPRASELSALDTALALDDTTAELRYGGAQASVPPILMELAIVPEHSLRAVPRSDLRTAAFNDAPIGNGPFRYVSRQRGARWTFARNDAFPASLGGPPKLEGFVVSVVDEATTKFAGLTSGELDVAGISPTMAHLAERDRTLRLLTYPVMFSSAICFNTTRPPFDDARVRRAVSRAIDRKRIVDIALDGYGHPSSSPVPPENAFASEIVVKPDTVLADSLLDAAGWRRGSNGVRTRGGRTLHVELLTVGTGDNIAEQLIQSDLAARGIELVIRQTELGSFLAAAHGNPRTFDMLLAGIPGDLALSYVGALFSSAQKGGALDYTGFHSVALDTLLARAQAASIGAERRAAWLDVQGTIDSLAPAAWIYHSRGVQGISRRVGGVRMDLRGELVTLHDWTLAAPPGR